MQTYIEERLDELRTAYRETGEAKYRYKYDELKRFTEYLLAEQIRGEQDTQQVQRRQAYTPASGGRLPNLDR
jgi:hypothetical protein